VLEQLEDMTRDGHMLSPDTIEAIGRKEAKKARVSTIALCVIAVASIGILIALIRM
jgi:ubiquinone biosynthesis protein